MKAKQKKLWIVVVVLTLICLAAIGTMLALLPGKDAEADFALNFGNIELETNTSTTHATKEVIITQNKEDLPEDSQAMPGDKVEINITVKLTGDSQPAYYLIYLGDANVFSCKREFFFASGDYVYATDGTDARRVDKNGNLTDEILDDNQVVGKITSADTHQISFVQQIDPNTTEDDLSSSRTFSCTVYAVKQASIDEDEVFTEIKGQEYAVTFGTGGVMTYEDGVISEMTALPSWKQAITNVYEYQTIGFYRTGKQPQTLSLNEALTASFDEKQEENGLETGKIKVYTNGTTELGFVSDYRIVAPEDSTALFSWIEVLFDDELSYGLSVDEDATYTINFSNFYTDNVKDMSCMFMLMPYKELDLSSWDTSNVTDMNEMFAWNMVCSELDLSSWDTSNVTDMSFMFMGMSVNIGAQFTELNLNGWDVSSVINMNGMFAFCEHLDKLDLSDFNTSSAIYMAGMFNGCCAITELDISGFDLTNVEEFDLIIPAESGDTTKLGKIVLPKEGKWGPLEDQSFSLGITAGYYLKSEKTGEILGKHYYNNVNFDITSAYAGDTLTACGTMFSTDFLYRIPNKTSITSIKFETTAPSGYTKVLSNHGMDYYVNSDSTQLVVVSPLTIYAVGSETGVASTEISFSEFTNLQTIEFNNFDTSKRTDLSGMFTGCTALTDVTITNSFTYNNSGTQTQFTKATLVEKTGLPSTVTVKKSGTVLE